MADGPGNPPPNPTDPWLESLTVEQVAQLVNEISPDVFYQRASAFDQAGGRLQDVLDRLRHELNHLRETWTGKGSDDFDALAREVSAKASVTLQFLQNPGYGAVLRNAGDQLAQHQRRMQDLQGQKAQQEATPPAPGAPPPEEIARANNDSAKQILRDLRTAYWDIGNGMTPLPFKAPQVVVDQSGGGPKTNDVTQGGGGDGDNSSGTPDPEGSDPTGANPEHVTYPNGGPVLTAVNLPGGGPVLFGDRDGRTLGRDQPFGMDHTEAYQLDGHGETGPYQVVGAGEPGPADPGPQQAFQSERLAEHTPVVLGQTVAPVGLTGFVPGVAGVPGVAVPPAVLGRSEKLADGCRPGTRAAQSGKAPGKERKEEKREPLLEEREPLLEERPETVSSAVSTPDELVVRTAVDAPELTPALTDEAREKAVQVATATGEPLLPEQAAATTEPAPETPADKQEKPLGPVDVSALTRKPLTFSASGGGGGPDLVAAGLDPETRGMFAPTATPDGLPAAAQLPAEAAASAAGTGGPGRGQADPYGSQHMGGFPMSPMMMGGMSGGMSQQNGRMSAVPNEPRPEMWDPLTDTPMALGRREAPPEPDREPRGEALTSEQIQARLTEKFAELDRLLERGK